MKTLADAFSNSHGQVTARELLLLNEQVGRLLVEQQQTNRLLWAGLSEAQRTAFAAPQRPGAGQ